LFPLLVRQLILDLEETFLYLKYNICSPIFHNIYWKSTTNALLCCCQLSCYKKLLQYRITIRKKTLTKPQLWLILSTSFTLRISFSFDTGRVMKYLSTGLG
jgi:hypothetical protein